MPLCPIADRFVRLTGGPLSFGSLAPVVSPASLERKLHLGRRVTRASALFWLLLGLLAVLAIDLGLTRLGLWDIMPLIGLGVLLALSMQTFFKPRLMSRQPVLLPLITPVAIGLQFLVLMQLIRIDEYGYLSAFGSLLGLVTLQCYLGIQYGGRISFLVGVALTLVLHSLYLVGRTDSSLFQPEEEFLCVGSALAICSVMAMANSFQRGRRDGLAHLYKQQAEQTRLIRRQRQALDLRSRALLEANENLRQVSLSDGLTGVANRRCFDESLHREWFRHTRGTARSGQQRVNDSAERPGLGLLLVDIDAFKAYNDRYGHMAGDDCLCRVAGAIRRATLRLGDLAARYGGEEFAVLLPETTLEGTENVALRVMANIEELNIPHEDSPVASIVTVSIGIAHLGEAPHLEVAAFLEMADQALYQAKNQGRNRIIVRLPA